MSWDRKIEVLQLRCYPASQDNELFVHLRLEDSQLECSWNGLGVGLGYGVLQAPSTFELLSTWPLSSSCWTFPLGPQCTPPSSGWDIRSLFLPSSFGKPFLPTPLPKRLGWYLLPRPHPQFLCPPAWWTIDAHLLARVPICSWPKGGQTQGVSFLYWTPSSGHCAW